MRSWTEEEVCVLQELYAQVGPEALSERMARSRRAILIKARRLGLRYHLQQRDCATCGLRKGDDKHRGLCQRCYRDPESRQSRPATYRVRAWTRREVDRLRAAYGRIPIADLCQELQRHENSVRSQAGYLGLSIPRRRIDMARLRELWEDGLVDSQIASEMGWRTEAITLARRRVGLPARCQIVKGKLVVKRDGKSIPLYDHLGEEERIRNEVTWSGCAVSDREAALLEAIAAHPGERGPFVRRATFGTSRSGERTLLGLLARGLTRREPDCPIHGRWHLAGAALAAYQRRCQCGEP